MNKQYKLTSDSKFMTVLRAAAEHDISIHICNNKTHPYYTLRGIRYNEWVSHEEVIPITQRIIDELKQKGGAQ